MMRVTFNQNFGAFQKGTEAEVSDQVGSSLLRVGVASPTSAEVKSPLPSTTQAYKPAKGIGKAIRKAI
jgi:hypothetical protein